MGVLNHQEMSRLYILKFSTRKDRLSEWKERLLVIENLNDDGKQIPQDDIMGVVARYVKASKTEPENFRPKILYSLAAADYIAFGDSNNKRVRNEIEGVAKMDNRPHLVFEDGEEKNQ